MRFNASREAQNDVGFGTIVGSAVFNVLFVIGLCGYVAKGNIDLTWWPLFRAAWKAMKVNVKLVSAHELGSSGSRARQGLLVLYHLIGCLGGLRL